MLLLLLSFVAHAAEWPVPDTAPDTTPWSSLETGVELQERVVGTGEPVVPGALVEVLYTGMLADGSVFDTTANRNDEPLRFKVGARQVISGWDDGLVGMRVGGVRRLVIPPAQGYADRATGSIPPNSTLYFEVQVVGVVPPRALPNPQLEEPVAWRDLEDGVRVVDLQLGDGRRVRPKHRVCIDYVLWRDTAVEEQTFTRDRCTWLRLADGNLPAPLELGLAGMREGGTRRIALPDGRSAHVEITASAK